MYQLFVILAVVTAVLLTFIVLIQESKGGGLASDFSGMNALAGVRKTTDIVEKLTWGLAVALVVFAVATTFCTVPSEHQDSSTIVTSMKATAPATPNVPGQQAPAAQD
ncbi:MAG: preprotein translocase subunit SecG [Bacteroidaceae bacterium]|nr:preprotein translocase subunit SecG [Bacteroidaceae bacterium]